MNKTLLSLALFGSMIHTANAQTNVTIYGVIDAGISYERNGNPAGNATRMDSGMLNGSRLGFRGSEDLGSGVKVVFAMENGFATDTGALGQGGRLFGRQSWVGLEGAFGSVKAGRQKNILFENAGSFDPFYNSLAGDSERLFNFHGSRSDNTLSYSYESPTGLRGEIDYGFGEVAGNSSARKTLGAYLGYKNGPLDVVVASYKENNAAGSDSARTVLVGGNYDLKFIKPYFAYAADRDVGALRTRESLVGFTAPVSTSGLFMASWILKQNKGVNQADGNQWAVGYIHTLSKRTALYTSFSHTNNESSASHNVAVAGASSDLVNFGIRHSF